MNSFKVCQNCGSSSFVSDRSLGGRIVCSKCGSTSFRKKSFSRFRSKNFLFPLIGIIIFLIIIN